MREFAWKQVDVFSAAPLRGNPVAVVLGAAALRDEEMQQIAAWTNLSETTFVLPATAPGASYRLRIFTPRAELPFAGHPTLGSAHAVREAGLASGDALLQECGAGLVPVRAEEGALYATTPPARTRGLSASSAEALWRALGQAPSGPAPRVVDLGPRWLVAALSSEEALHALAPDLAALAALSLAEHITGVSLCSLRPGEDPVYVRSFAPAHGVPEDPVCGSGNAAVAAFLRETGLLETLGARYTARQGHELGRAGRVLLRVTGAEIEIGGACVTTLEGRLRLP